MTNPIKGLVKLANSPLFLPPGSIRAILALIIVGAIIRQYDGDLSQTEAVLLFSILAAYGINRYVMETQSPTDTDRDDAVLNMVAGAAESSDYWKGYQAAEQEHMKQREREELQQLRSDVARLTLKAAKEREMADREAIHVTQKAPVPAFGESVAGITDTAPAGAPQQAENRF